MRTSDVDDIFRIINDLEEKVARLENARPENIHFVGGSSEPGFQNSWVNYDVDRPAGFYRHNGRVYLTGVIKSGTLVQTAFTLPAGYRPLVGGSSILIFTDSSNGAYGELWVYADGRVVPAIGSNVYFSLEISFRHV